MRWLRVIHNLHLLFSVFSEICTRTIRRTTRQRRRKKRVKMQRLVGAEDDDFPPSTSRSSADLPRPRSLRPPTDSPAEDNDDDEPLKTPRECPVFHSKKSRSSLPFTLVSHVRLTWNSRVTDDVRLACNAHSTHVFGVSREERRFLCIRFNTTTTTTYALPSPTVAS